MLVTRRKTCATRRKPTQLHSVQRTHTRLGHSISILDQVKQMAQGYGRHEGSRSVDSSLARLSTAHNGLASSELLSSAPLDAGLQPLRLRLPLQVLHPISCELGVMRIDGRRIGHSRVEAARWYPVLLL